jgi:hypothetical protein
MAKLPKIIYVRKVKEYDEEFLSAGENPEDIVAEDVTITYAGEYVLKREIKILHQIIVEVEDK